MASGSLKLYLSANSQRLTRDMSKARKSVSNFADKAGAALKKFGARAALISVAVAAGFIAMTKSALSAGDNLQKLSIRLNESTEALSQYQHVAEITGVSFEDITNSFAKLQKGITDAEDGLSTAATALEDLGVEIKDVIKLKPSEQFELIADAIFKIEAPAKRTQIAMDLMGRSGSRMLSTMAEGGEGIRKLREEYDAMGGTLSQVDANQIAAANDAITRIGAAARITGQLLAVTFAADIESLANTIKDFLPDLKNFFTRISGRIPQDELEKLIKNQENLNAEMKHSIALADADAKGRLKLVRGYDLLTERQKRSLQLTIEGSKNFKKAADDRDVIQNSLFAGEEKLASLIEKRSKKPVTIGGGGDDEGAALAKAIETKVQAIETGLMSEEQKLAESFVRKTMFIDQNVTDTERAEKIKFDLRTEYENKSLSLIEKNANKQSKIEANKNKNIAHGIERLASIVAEKGKVGFRIHQAAAIAEALVNTHVGVTAALAKANYPLAFAIAASGAASVASIASTSPSGGGGGVSSPIAPPLPEQESNGNGQGGSGTVVTVNIYGNAVGDESVKSLIRDSIVDAIDSNNVNLATQSGEAIRTVP